MSMVLESFSPSFGISGSQIYQTLNQSFDAFSGFDIDNSIFQNTNQGLIDSNQDGRIGLGMFFFKDINQSEDSFPDVLPAPFKAVQKLNLVRNGDCKYAEEIYYSVEDYVDDINDDGVGFNGSLLNLS